MARTIETVVILVALASLWPLILGYEWSGSPWYKFGYLALLLVALLWVTSRRLRRIRQAASQARQRREETQKGRRPPWLS